MWPPDFIPTAKQATLIRCSGEICLHVHSSLVNRDQIVMIKHGAVPIVGRSHVTATKFAFFAEEHSMKKLQNPGLSVLGVNISSLVHLQAHLRPLPLSITPPCLSLATLSWLLVLVFHLQEEIHRNPLLVQSALDRSSLPPDTRTFDGKPFLFGVNPLFR